MSSRDQWRQQPISITSEAHHQQGINGFHCNWVIWNRMKQNGPSLHLSVQWRRALGNKPSQPTPWPHFSQTNITVNMSLPTTTTTTTTPTPTTNDDNHLIKGQRKKKRRRNKGMGGKGKKQMCFAAMPTKFRLCGTFPRMRVLSVGVGG